jgi:hypothetical protein
MPVGVAWLISVAVTWLVTTPLLALLIKATGDRASTGDVIGLAAASATFACVVVGGPATAVALRVRARNRQRRAVVSGLVIAGLVLLFSWSYVAATGTSVPAVWPALLPQVIITSAQLGLALWLRRHCRAEASAEQTPPGQTPPGPAPTGLGTNRASTDRVGTTEQAPPTSPRPPNLIGAYDRRTRRRKFPMSSGPARVRIDSGWNCTPSTGNVRCRTAMGSLADRAVTASTAGRLASASKSE